MADCRFVRQELTVKHKITPDSICKSQIQVCRGKHPKDNLEDLSRVSDWLTREGLMFSCERGREKGGCIPSLYLLEILKKKKTTICTGCASKTGVKIISKKKNLKRQ